MNLKMNQDRWTAVTCFVIAVAVMLAIPSQTSDRPLPGARGFDLLDGAFFPELAVILFAFAAVWLFIEVRPRKIDSGMGAPDVVSDDQPPGMTLGDLFWALALSGGVLIYVQLLEPFGYLPCTIVGVLILAFICGQRSWSGFFFGGIVFPSIVFYLFTRFFMVPLPRGEFSLGW